MVGLITGALATQAVRTLAELAIADVLAVGPMNADDLARKLGTNPSSTARLMRAATALGLVTANADGIFASNEMLEMLRSESPDSLRGWAIIMGSPGAWRPWGNMVQSVQTGEAQALATLGKPYWAYLQDAPTESNAFAVGMSGISTTVSELAARAIDPGGASIAVDVGGGTGTLLYALLSEHERMRGVVYDTPDVVALAEKAASELGLADRARFVAGDFLESVPEGDLFLLKWILHDWDDAHCTTILTNCRRAMRPGGRLVAIELQLGEIDDPGLSSLMDLNMMSITNGRERTTHEFERLFAGAGLTLEASRPLQAPLGPWNVLEARAT